MFKFIRKKIFEGIIKDLIEKIPEYKDYAILYFEQNKDAIIDKIEKMIVNLMKDEIAKMVKKGIK